MMISTFLNEQETIRAQSMKRKEDMYLEQIEVILQDLQRTHQVISAKLVCDLLGTTLPKLRYYYRVRARLEQLAEDTRRQNR